LTIISKLSDRTINGELLKYLAKTSNDEQPGIRTNTTICLGKISKNLGVSTRSKVLIAAFTRSLRDPFVHARNAALMALAVTSDAFNDDDCANKILPALCPCLIDKEKLVRDQANKTMDAYLQRVRKFASTMPDTVLPPPSAAETSNSTTPRMSTPQPSEAASWTGWAISSFTNKVSSAAGEIQPNSDSNGTAPRPPSAPLTSEVRRPAPGTASASALHRQAVATPPALSTRTSTSSNAQDYFQDSNTGEGDDIDAWGDMEEESFFDAPSEATPKTSAANPFQDDGEPDFAGWLAAQAQKKPGSKPLPKGLAKPAASNGGRPTAGRATTTGTVGGTGAKKAAGTAVKPKPVVAKKIDTAPKVTDDDDGWGDGW
jgi:SCY1-like protein 1